MALQHDLLHDTKSNDAVPGVDFATLMAAPPTSSPLNNPSQAVRARAVVVVVVNSPIDSVLSVFFCLRLECVVNIKLGVVAAVVAAVSAIPIISSV